MTAERDLMCEQIWIEGQSGLNVWADYCVNYGTDLGDMSMSPVIQRDKYYTNFMTLNKSGIGMWIRADAVL